MKNIVFKISLVLVLAMTFSACSEDFINDPKPTDQVNEDVIFSSRTGVNAYISGIMRRFRGQFNSTDAAGVNSIYYARTVKGNDIIQRNTWFSFDYENDNREPGYRRTTFTWEYCYYMIGQANLLIQGIENSASLSSQDKAETLGQAKAIRAFFYFQLAMEYQHTYTYDASLPSPPVVTTTDTSHKPMGTLQEMYDLILDDLTFATTNLTSDRLGKSYINREAAFGILARVYLVMENWPGAEYAAKQAYGGTNPYLNASSYGTGFNDYSNPEWIWGSAQSPDQSNYYWGAPHAHTDHFVLSYAATFFNVDFVDLFSPTDVRNLFVNGYGVPDSDYRRWITTKFTFAFDSDHPIIRTAEMLLTEAEAIARQGGKDAIAADLLFTLQSNRDPNATPSGNTGQDLIDEILVERRKELYAEIGVEWFDAKRTRTGITRTGNHRIMNASLTPDDKKFFLKIPQSEIDANNLIDDSVNANR